MIQVLNDNSFKDVPQNNGFFRPKNHAMFHVAKFTYEISRRLRYLSSRINDLFMHWFKRDCREFSNDLTCASRSYSISIKKPTEWHDRLVGAFWYCMGSGNTLLYRKKTAINNFQKAVIYNPTNTHYRTVLARACLEQHNYKEAISNYVAAVILSPYDELYHINLCHVFFKSQELDQGVAQIESLIQKDPENPCYYRDLGKIYLHKREFAKATNAFLQAHELQPRQQEILELVPQYLKIAGGREKVLELLLQCLEKEKSKEPYLETLTALYLQEGENDKAFELFIQIAQLKADLDKDDIDRMWCKWRSVANSSYCREWQARRLLCDYIMNETMKNPPDIKKNFANMHAEPHLKSNAVLRKMEGGEKKMTGPYFLHLLRHENNEPCLIKFTDQLSGILEEYQKTDLAYYGAGEAMKKNAGKNIKPLDLQFAELRDQEVENHLNHIRNLQLGQDYIFLTNWYYKDGTAHALAYTIRLQKDGNYTFIVVNSGDGTHNHMAYYQESKKKLKIHPFYYVRDIPAKTLNNRSFIEDLVKLTRRQTKLDNADQFYKIILKKFGGRISKGEKLEQAKDMITPQRSGSCVWSFWLALLRLYLPFKDYKKVIFRIKARSIIQFNDVFRGSFGSDQEAQLLMEIAVNAYLQRLQKINFQLGPHAIESLLSREEKEAMAQIIRQFKPSIDYASIPIS
jgi:tetratricopeptide (TPR) repeat protein